MKEARLSAGTIRYRDIGEGPVLVFVHGLLVNGTLWRNVARSLSSSYRCIIPDWPLGSHSIPMNDDADLSPEGVAKIVAEFLAALDLEDVTLVGNDSGGAITQLVAARHGDRVARVVLTTCDAFEVFPPKLFAYLKYVTYVPGLMKVLGSAMLAIPALQRLPISYGLLAKRRIPQAIVDGWIKPGALDRRIRRDVAKFIRGLSPRVTLAVARELPNVDKPFLLVWTPEDTSFPLSLAHRLQATLRNAKLVLVDDSLVFVAEDQPEALARSLRAFVPPTLSPPIAQHLSGDQIDGQVSGTSSRGSTSLSARYFRAP